MPDYSCELCDVDVVYEDEGCPHCNDTLCPACCVEQLED